MDVRRATPTEAIAEVHVRSWQRGYRGLLPDDYLDGLRPADRAGSYDLDPSVEGPLTLVAVVHGSVCGFTAVGPARDADCAGLGEVYALYTDPACWGTGVGTALLTAGREGLQQRGHDAAVLWVLHGNDRACRFYAAQGWRPDETRRRSEIWGTLVDEQRFRTAAARQSRGSRAGRRRQR